MLFFKQSFTACKHATLLLLYYPYLAKADTNRAFPTVPSFYLIYSFLDGQLALNRFRLSEKDVILIVIHTNGDKNAPRQRGTNEQNIYNRKR